MSETVSVPAGDLAQLREARRILDAMYTNPDHGMAVKRAFKAVKPDAVIPELATDAAIQPYVAKLDEVTAGFTAFKEHVAAKELEREQRAQADALAARMGRARDDYKLDDAAMDGVVKLMGEKGIMDPADAAELYVNRLPKPKMASNRTGHYGAAAYVDLTGYADEAEKQALLMADSDKFLVNEITQVLAEEGVEP